MLQLRVTNSVDIYSGVSPSCVSDWNYSCLGRGGYGTWKSVTATVLWRSVIYAIAAMSRPIIQIQMYSNIRIRIIDRCVSRACLTNGTDGRESWDEGANVSSKRSPIFRYINASVRFFSLLTYAIRSIFSQSTNHPMFYSIFMDIIYGQRFVSVVHIVMITLLRKAITTRMPYPGRGWSIFYDAFYTSRIHDVAKKKNENTK